MERTGERTLEDIQYVLLYWFGWLLIPDEYGPGEVLISISVSSNVFELLAMVGLVFLRADTG